MKLSHSASHKKSTTTIIILVAVGLLVAAALVWWFALRGDQSAPAVPDQSSSTPGDRSEQQEIAQKKESIPTDRPQTPEQSQSGTKARVSPIITGFSRSTDGTQLLVDGGVNEVVERGGVCRFVVSWSGGELSQQTEGENAPSSTNCQTARFAMEQLPAGVNLTLQLRYTSTKYQGDSTNGPSTMKEHIK